MPAKRSRKIISGGQTGADRGGLDAAIELGIPHGGACPKGRRAEDGVIPGKYALGETRSTDYVERTEQNVIASDGTVVFTFGAPEGGSALTVELATQHRKPLLHLDLKRIDEEAAARELGSWIRKNEVAILNVAGSRESKAAGLGKLVWRIVKAAYLQERAGG